MKRFLIVLISISFLFLFAGCESRDEAYQRGFYKGNSAGRNEASQDYENRLKSRDLSNKKDLEQKKSEYEKKIESAYAAAYQKGRESMESDLNETIAIKE